jgi:hypothetical protein
MLRITYINGFVQNINVDGSFFVNTIAEKNGKKSICTPMEKAEGLAFDLSYVRQSGVSKFELFEDEFDEGKIRIFAPVREKENIYAYLLKTAEYKAERKILRNKFKNVPFTSVWRSVDAVSVPGLED